MDWWILSKKKHMSIHIESRVDYCMYKSDFVSQIIWFEDCKWVGFSQNENDKRYFEYFLNLFFFCQVHTDGIVGEWLENNNRENKGRFIGTHWQWYRMRWKEWRTIQ